MQTGIQRRRQFAILSVSGVLLAGVVLILANVLLNWLYLRIDLTRSNAYSLSASSKKLVRSLDDPVVIKAYFSTDLPVPYNTFARYVKDLLTEYRAVSRGRVRFEFVSPYPSQEFERKAQEANIPSLQFEEAGSDKLQIRRGFLGLVMFYQDRSETLPVVKSLDNLEYELTSRLARMTRKNKKVIGTFEGHGETPWRTSHLKLAQDLPTFYDLENPISLPRVSTAPISADALLVVSPMQKYDDKSLWEIDQAIMRGIPAAFLVDGKRFFAQQFMMMSQPTGLEDLLKTYGVNLTEQLIYDAQCETVGMTQNLGGLAFTSSIRYPFMPMVTNFERRHPILRGVEAIGLPFPWRLDPGTLPPGVKFTPLLFSSDRSWAAPANTYSVAPNSIPTPKADEPHGPYTLGAVLEGSFPSYFAGKPAPVKGGEVIAKSPKTTIFVLGTSQVLNPSLPEFPGIDVLLTNALAYLSKDDSLIGIQSKGNIFRPLRPLPGPVKEAIKFAVIVGVSLLPVVWGLLRWRRRRVWRRTITAELTSPVPVS